MPRGVPHTQEFARILELPRRQLSPQDVTADDIQLLSNAWRRNPHGPEQLFPAQVAACCDLHDHVQAGGRGHIGPYAVGAGKALISCLAGLAVQQSGRRVQSAVWLVPANLVAQSTAVARAAEQTWKIDYKLHVLSYEALSSPRQHDVLERLAPDVIACDEAHKLRRGSSVRTKRFRHYVTQRAKNFPADAPIVLFLSGTITSRSLQDFSWMFYYTHDRLSCPVPVHYPTLRDWDDALGVNTQRLPLAPGVLQQFAAPGESAREGYKRRLLETRGCVGTTTSSCAVALNIWQEAPNVPEVVQKALTDVRKHGRTPFGLVFDDPLAESRYCQQLALGYYLRWQWPGDKPDQAWLDARANWSLELRSLLARRSTPGLDSPALITAAVAAGRLPAQYYQPWLREQARFGPTPPVVVEWISDYMVDYLHQRTYGDYECSRGGVVWYYGQAFGEALRKRQWSVFDAGTDRALLQRAAPTGSIRGWLACSIPAHGTGKNLQKWDQALVVSPPSSGQIWEQLLGRHHRPGQESDEVDVYVWAATPEQRAALASARRDAEYLQALQGPQKLLQATYG